MLGRMIDELHRAPGAARLLAEPRQERLVAEVVGHARGVRKHLARRCARKGIERAPALKQFGSELTSERVVKRQAPLVGEADRHCGGQALRDARRAEGVVRPKGAALPAGQVSGRAAPRQAGAGRLNARQRTGRTGRQLRLDRSRRRADTAESLNVLFSRKTPADLLSHRLVRRLASARSIATNQSSRNG